MTAGSIAVPTIVPLRPPIPGKPKTSIDSNTKVELNTESLGAKIYYTINGTKPDPFPKVGISSYTMEYHVPFTLPAGKQTVKALAVSVDGMRESNVVTKVFEVDYIAPPDLPPEDDDMEFREDLERERTLLNIKRAQKNLLLSQKTAWADKNRRVDEVRGSNYRQPGTGTRFLNSRQERSPNRNDILSSRSDRTLSPHRSRQLPDNTTQTMRPHTDFPKYVYCFEDRPYDPYARFSQTGGNDGQPIQTKRLPPPEPGQMGTCLDCKTLVPFNTSSCVVCEAPMSNMNKPQANVKFADKNPAVTAAALYGIKIEPPFGGDIPMEMPPKPSKTVATQTVGLFYPSTRGMEKEKEKEEEKMAFEKQMRDRRPLLTAVSPGKGYWRKQIEHICQHVKAHAQNDAEFRALIGEPKMGKLLTSTVQEDGYELSLTVTFALRGGKDKFAGKKLGITGDYLSYHIEDNQTTYRSDSDDYNEVIEDIAKKGTKKVVKKRKPVSKVSKQDQLLLKEIGQNGEGDPTEVQQLLDEGSDPNCLNKNGIPALHIAARNKKSECISVLVDGGAEVDKKGPVAIKGNTALHEAVSLGPSGSKVVDALLSAGANQNIKNEKGDTPYDMAVKGGYENLVKKFAAVLGQSQLEKMIRPKTKGY